MNSTNEQTNEVERLKEMIMDAAKRGDEMAVHWKERAEKAESIIKQLHNFAETNFAETFEICMRNHDKQD